MKKSKWFLSWMLVPLFLFAVGVSGCASDEETVVPDAETAVPAAETAVPAAETAAPAAETAVPVAETAEPAEETVLRYAAPSFGVERMDPSKGFTGAITTGPLIDWLTVFSSDGELEPGLALSWEQADDGLSWTFKLREGVKFHNGDEMTGEDVRFSLMDGFTRDGSTSANIKRFRASLREVEVVDDYTVRMHTNGPWVTLPHDLSTFGGIEGVVLPSKYIQEVGWDGYEENPIGTGPWTFVRFETGNIIEFEANDDYWNGRPKFDRLEVLLVPEGSTRIAMLEAGEIDIADIALDKATSLESAGFTVVEYPIRATVRINLWGTYEEGWSPYYSDPVPTASKEVRQALNLAINRQELVDALFAGRGEPAAITQGSHSIGYQELEPYPFDPDRARELLAEAGYPDGFDMSIFSYGAGPFPSFQQVAEAAAGYWQQIGVNVDIIPTDLGVMRPKYFGELPQDESIIGNAGVIGLPTGLNGLNDLNIWFNIKGGNMKLAGNTAHEATLAAEAATTLEDLAGHVRKGFRIIYDDYRNVPIAHTPGSIWAYGNGLASVDPYPSLSSAIQTSLWRAEPAGN